MRCWDSSALVPLLLAGPASPRRLELYRDDPALLVWWEAVPVKNHGWF